MCGRVARLPDIDSVSGVIFLHSSSERRRSGKRQLNSWLEQVDRFYREFLEVEMVTTGVVNGEMEKDVIMWEKGNNKGKFEERTVFRKARLAVECLDGMRMKLTQKGRGGIKSSCVDRRSVAGLAKRVIMSKRGKKAGRETR